MPKGKILGLDYFSFWHHAIAVFLVIIRAVSFLGFHANAVIHMRLILAIIAVPVRVVK